jgi:hypothetical protein
MFPNAKIRIESVLEDLKILMRGNKDCDELVAAEDLKDPEATSREATAFVDRI